MKPNQKDLTLPPDSNPDRACNPSLDPQRSSGHLVLVHNAEHRRCLLRDECLGGPRPCPLVGCVYNTYLTVNKRGHIEYSHPERAPEDVPPHQSCVLDVADLGDCTLDEIGEILGITREGVRQIEMKILEKIHKTIENKND